MAGELLGNNEVLSNTHIRSHAYKGKKAPDIEILANGYRIENLSAILKPLKITLLILVVWKNKIKYSDYMIINFCYILLTALFSITGARRARLKKKENRRHGEIFQILKHQFFRSQHQIFRSQANSEINKYFRFLGTFISFLGI